MNDQAERVFEVNNEHGMGIEVLEVVIHSARGINHGLSSLRVRSAELRRFKLQSR